MVLEMAWCWLDNSLGPVSNQTITLIIVRLAMIALSLNTLRPKQNGRHSADDIFKCIFLNENEWIWLKISLKFVPKGPMNNIPALVQIMAWRRPGDKPLSEPMMVSLPMHICITRPQWVNSDPSGPSQTSRRSRTDSQVCYMFLNIKWKIFQSMLHKPASWHFDISVPPRIS